MSDSLLPCGTHLRGPVPLAHMILRNVVGNGSMAVDATCGNGHDTLLLAALVGDQGHVWGFDIQARALSETGRRIAEAGFSDRVTLLQTGHEELAQRVPAPIHAIVFNLGYLPGGDRNIITRPGTTLPALDQSLQLLAPGGVIMLTVYPGHRGGDPERQGVEQWAASRDQKTYHCWRMGQTNVGAEAPYLFMIQKTP